MSFTGSADPHCRRIDQYKGKSGERPNRRLHPVWPDNGIPQCGAPLDAKLSFLLRELRDLTRELRAQPTSQSSEGVAARLAHSPSGATAPVPAPDELHPPRPPGPSKLHRQLTRRRPQ